MTFPVRNAAPVGPDDWFESWDSKETPYITPTDTNITIVDITPIAGIVSFISIEIIVGGF